MKKNLFLPLIAIVLVAGLLFGLSFLLKDTAAKKTEENLLWHMQTILPGSSDFTEEVYTGEDASIRSVHKAETGYVIETKVQGYAGPITMLVGVRNDGKVSGLVVTELSETFGLGKEALNDHVFLAQFLNTSGNVSIETGADAFSGATSSSSEDGEGVSVDAITGATVTSKAIARAVNSAVAFVTGTDADSGATSWGG